MKRLLRTMICVDFRENMEWYLENAMHVGARISEKIYLVHIIPDLSDYKDKATDGADFIRTIAETKLEEISMMLKNQGINQVETIVKNGHPARNIVELGTQLDVNLVIMKKGGVSKPSISRPHS